MRFVKSLSWVVVLFLLFASLRSYGAGFTWDVGESTYQKSNEIFARPFYALSPLAVAAAGLPSGEGYGTVASDGLGNPYDGSTAYGGAAPASLVDQGINERPGHYYFGFANTYPTVDSFSAYELSGTNLSAGTYMNLCFRRTKNASNEYDPINFIGICGDTVEHAEVYERESGGNQFVYIAIKTVNPVYSTKGGGDQDAVFGLYINYGNYDDGNEGVDYDGAVFRTNIHWWDIEVPEIPEDRLASIQLSTQANTDATIVATVPNSYIDSIGLTPDDVKGYVDEDELPMGQGSGETYSFAKVTPKTELEYGLHGDQEYVDVSEFVIHNDQWSTHNIGVGVIPEPATLALCLCGAAAMLIRKRR